MQDDPVQREAREKARALVEAAKQSRQEAYDRASEQAVKELKGMLKDLAESNAKLLKSNKVLRQRLSELQRRGMLEGKGISSAKKTAWYKANKNFNEVVEKVDDLGGKLNKVADAGNKSFSSSTANS